MARELKEDFFRLDGAWASFELMSICNVTIISSRFGCCVQDR